MAKDKLMRAQFLRHVDGHDRPEAGKKKSPPLALPKGPDGKDCVVM